MEVCLRIHERSALRLSEKFWKIGANKLLPIHIRHEWRVSARKQHALEGAF